MPRLPRTLFALLLVAGLAPAAEPTAAQVADADKRVKAFRDALPKPTVVLTNLDAGKVSFDRETKTFDANSDKGLPGLLTAAGNLARAAADKDTKKREAEAIRFTGVLKGANPNAVTETVVKLARDTGAVKFGVVVESTDSAFKLTAAELAKDPAAAKKRVADWVKAMGEQSARLEAVAKDLKTIAARAGANQRTLKDIDGKVQEFVRLNGAKDIVNKDAVAKHFDPGLVQKYETLARSATEAGKKAEDAKKAQDALLAAVKDKAKLLDGR